MMNKVFEYGTSILVLAAVCAAHPATDHHGNRAPHRPIGWRLDVLHVCAELCRSGLGGDPCGLTCLAVAPKEMPTQSVDGSDVSSTSSAAAAGFGPRRDACDVLCDNGLGMPLCKCATTEGIKKRFEDVDFDGICSFYCNKYNYTLNGCNTCLDDGVVTVDAVEAVKYLDEDEVDWDEWCRTQCAIGEGGAACYCDILPLSAPWNGSIG